MAKRLDRDFECTIAPKLFEAWQKLRRKGDPEAIMELTKKSRPIIDKALKYGHVKDQTIIDVITKYYNDRLNAENQQGNILLKSVK